MKKIVLFTIIALLVLSLATPVRAFRGPGERHRHGHNGPEYGPRPRPDQGQRPPHPDSHQRRRPGPPPYRHRFYHYDPTVWIWFSGSDWAEDNASQSYTVDAADVDGTVVIVPGSPSGWQTQIDIAAGMFTMSADLRLPPHIASDDVASIRSVFNDAVDRNSISTAVGSDFDHLSATGRIGNGRGFSSVELLQLILERTDGRTYVQNVKIGLK